MYAIRSYYETQFIFYGFAMVYILMGLIHVIRSRKKLSLHKRISLYLYLALMVAAVVVQFLIPEYATLGMAWTIGLMIIYFDQYKANELLDDRTGLNNKNAFVTAINSRIKENSTFSVVAMDLFIPEDIITEAEKIV